MRQDFIRLKVAEAMRDKNVTNGDIAKILGTSSGATSNVLLGRSGTSEERWRIICAAVGVDLNEIIQAEMAGRLPGICEVEAAWAALRSGEPYTRLEILAEAAAPEENSLSLRASAEPAPPEEEPFGRGRGASSPVPPVPCRDKGSDQKPPSPREVASPQGEDGRSSPPAFSPDELSLMLEGLKQMFHNAVRMYPGVPDMGGIGRLNRLTGLILRLAEALEGGDEHAG